MFWTIGSVILILLKPLLGEISEDDRDLSTDILEYVLRRGEGKHDSTIASDILGFVKNKIEDSTFEEIPQITTKSPNIPFICTIAPSESGNIGLHSVFSP